MNNEKPAVSQDAFHRHLERVSRSVAKWPKWKQELLGGKATVRKKKAKRETQAQFVQRWSHSMGAYCDVTSLLRFARAFVRKFGKK